MNPQPSWLATALADRRLLPDSAVRAGIRRLIAANLREDGAADPATEAQWLREFADERRTGPIAVERADDALRDSIPDDLYHLVLGRHLKYSCAYWDDRTTSLDDAQEQMLALIAERAVLEDGQRILDLGCGWGSLTLWLAERFPAADITAVSNAPEHRQWIDLQARRRGLTRVEAVAADVNEFDTDERFDRVLSIEMFEHLRNWPALLARVARWIDDDGRLFLQMLTRRRYTRPSAPRDRSDWVSAYFFGGGLMPADRLLFEFQDDLTVVDHWRLSGQHYRRTLDAWLGNLERHETDVMRVLRAAHGADARRRWLRLRLFFMTCAELWGWDDGDEWHASHYALTRPEGARVRAAAT